MCVMSMNHELMISLSMVLDLDEADEVCRVVLTMKGLYKGGLWSFEGLLIEGEFKMLGWQ